VVNHSEGICKRNLHTLKVNAGLIMKHWYVNDMLRCRSVTSKCARNAVEKQSLQRLVL
jgi:hypothetical protein